MVSRSWSDPRLTERNRAASGNEAPWNLSAREDDLTAVDSNVSPAAANLRASGKRHQRSSPARYRLDVVGRAVAAIAGGFVAASAVGTAVAAVLFQTGVLARGPAVSAGTNLTFLVWAGAAMWAFSARRHSMVWFGLLIPTIIGVAVAASIGFEA